MTPTLNKLIQAKEKEFMDRYEGANTIQSSISSFMAKDIFKFVSQSIQSGYEQGIEDVEKLEYMKEEKFSKQKLPYLQIMVNNEVIIRNDLRERIKLQLQSLLKGETNGKN